MPATPPTSAEPRSCPHGPRAGTTTCLYCRNEERALARQRRNRFLTRFGVIAMGSSVVIALIIGAIISIVPERAPSATADSADGAPAAAPSTVPPLALVPTIPEGTSTIADSIVAERQGGEVTVRFDTELLRTRYDHKFEGVVRATLPAVFGADARAALDSVPSGEFVRGGNLLTELPTRGIRLALSDGRSLTVRPITRPGQDGPLVIGYRASGSRN